MNPYEVLGVEPTASDDEVVAAYHSLLHQFHPDKHAEAPAELQELAELRTRQTTDAMHRIRDERKWRVQTDVQEVEWSADEQRRLEMLQSLVQSQHSSAIWDVAAGKPIGSGRRASQPQSDWVAAMTGVVVLVAVVATIAVIVASVI